jgi:murein L,D-transpeptidase YcbB/YkuD
LQRYRLLEKQGGWPVLPEGPTVLPGARDSRLAVLARRLALSGDLDGGLGAVSQYDAVLQTAVRRFQSRHGLEPDAEIGPATLSALNVFAAQRVDQIRLNLERARWAFDESKDSYVLVNIPAFRADIVRDGQTSWSANVVVGEREEQTPVLRSELRYVVFNPTWTVPYSIATEELLPRIQSDSNFLERDGYEILDRAGSRVDPDTIDWSALTSDHFPYTLVQQPGSANQLGQIKFVFPNDYSLCIHDTPAKGLFAEAERAFSHGCVRLERPLDFAEQILGEQGWTRAAIDGEIQTAQTRAVSLPEPLPVSLVYWTTEVDDFGVVHFYPDIYEQDAALLAALDALVGG